MNSERATVVIIGASSSIGGAIVDRFRRSHVLTRLGWSYASNIGYRILRFK